MALDLIHRIPQYAEERMSTTPTEAALHADVAHLAALDRLPCSPGEAEAAAWIADRLRAAGADRVRVDEELVHGTYFTPLGVLNAVGALGGIAVLGGRRVVGGVAAAAAATGLWQDLTGARKRTLRRFLKRQTTTNVIAEFGPADAAHTLVVHAHHDAARTSFIFDQTFTRFVAEKTALMEKTDRWPPLMGLVFGGPAAVAIGAATRHRKTVAVGTVFAAGTAGLMRHMIHEPVVPGANDNLSGVAVLLEVARRLGSAAGPPPGVRVILLSAGAEEANQEGMFAFARRYFDTELTPGRTSFLSLDTVGSPDLVLIEGEGFLRMYEYPSAMKERVAAAAREAGVALRRGMRFTFATDGLVPLRRGFQAASIGSVTEHLVPSNYHWPTDTPDRVRYDTVAGAVDVVMGTIARSAEPLG
jgi:Peptidase family M28